MNRSNAVILLGGNIGNVPLLFSKAKHAIAADAGRIVLQSAIYQSEPWGFTDENLFYNAILEIETTLTPEELLLCVQKTELMLGRNRKTGEGYVSRPIDIDILWFDKLVIKTERLTIPHPLMQLRRFTLQPLLENWAEWQHPLLGKSIAQLYLECPDRSEVVKMDTLHF